MCKSRDRDMVTPNVLSGSQAPPQAIQTETTPRCPSNSPVTMRHCRAMGRQRMLFWFGTQYLRGGRYKEQATDDDVRSE